MFLSMMSPAKRQRLLATLTLERHTPNTLIDPAALEVELTNVRRQGYALDDEEFLSGLFCIAVPIHDPSNGACLAGLALQAPVVRLNRDNAAERLPVLRAAADVLAGMLI
jgi:DNA-binding IclR family transcriptional regulator